MSGECAAQSVRYGTPTFTGKQARRGGFPRSEPETHRPGIEMRVAPPRTVFALPGPRGNQGTWVSQGTSRPVPAVASGLHL